MLEPRQTNCTTLKASKTTQTQAKNHPCRLSNGTNPQENLEASQSVQSKKGGEDPDLLLSWGKSKPSCKSLSGMKECCFGFTQL